MQRGYCRQTTVKAGRLLHYTATCANWLVNSPLVLRPSPFAARPSLASACALTSTWREGRGRSGPAVLMCMIVHGAHQYGNGNGLAAGMAMLDCVRHPPMPVRRSRPTSRRLSHDPRSSQVSHPRRRSCAGSPRPVTRLCTAGLPSRSPGPWTSGAVAWAPQVNEI